MKEEYIGRASRRVREFALYGETTGETDELGLPIRGNWAAEYRGAAAVVYGHTPVGQADWLNRTINIDTGCVFGGRLTALRWPERELVSVPAKQTYAEPGRPFQGAAASNVAQANVPGIDDPALRTVVLRESESDRIADPTSNEHAIRSAPSLTAQQQHDDVLDLADVAGKRIITTRLHHSVTVREENATAALEVMSRFAANPKWLQGSTAGQS
jgi:protein phosphatase